MEPKKQSKGKYMIASIGLVIILMFSFSIGMAMTKKSEVEINKGIKTEGIDSINLFLECLNTQIEKEPLNIEWNQYVKKSIMWGGFLWFLICASYFNSKKNYIAGKEYGTAEWGTQKDIKDLFASTLMEKEIKQAKRVRGVIGRWLELRNLKKTCRKNSYEIKLVEMKKLEEWKAQNIPRFKIFSRKQRQSRKDLKKEYIDRKNEIKQVAKKRNIDTLKEAWKPYAIKDKYNMEIESIDRKYTEKIEIITEVDKEAAEQKAKKYYKNELKSFYSGKKNIQKIKNKYENADALFTKTERISIHNYILNNNTIILGGSGSGKTRGFVMPNILQAHSSFVITDPKGEILEKSGYFLETIKGYKIHVLNLDDKSKSDGYNPFAYIHPEREGYEERVLMLIEAIIINTDGGEKKGGSDPFWDKAERLFLQAIFFFTCDGFIAEEQNMNTVLSLIGMLKIEEDDDSYDSELDGFVEVFKESYGEDHIGVQQYKEFREKASGKTAKSIVISAVARLAPFRTSAIKRIFSYDTMQLDRLGEEKTAVFVVVPPTDTTFNFIAGMLFTQMFQELQYCATQVHKHDGQKLPVPVRFILDEFANTCTIPQFVKILAYARSFGIGIVPILQSLEQIKNMYKDEWGVVVDNCNTLLYLGSIAHMDTLEYMSKLLGKGTFDKKTTGISKGKSGSSSQNFDVIGRDLMDTAEIRKLPKSKCLFIVGGRNPFYSDKYDYANHPNYKYTSDGNKSYSYEYEPQKPVEKPNKDKKVSNDYEENKQERINARVKLIKEDIISEVDEIKMSFGVSNILSKMGESFEYLEPISEELLAVDDGTTFSEEELLLLEFEAEMEDRKKDNIRNETDDIRKDIDSTDYMYL